MREVATRNRVGNVLCSYASAFLRLLNGRPKVPIRQHLCTFIDAQMARKRHINTPNLHLLDVVSCEVNSGVTSVAGHHIIWVLSVLAACVIVLDSEMFAHPRALKLVISASAPAAVHRSPAVRSMHALVWRCLIWAFGRLGGRSYELDLERLAADAKMDADDLRERAFRLVGQELSRGNGAALLATLCPRPRPEADHDRSSDRDDARRVVTTLKQIIHHENRATREEGILAFARLLGPDTNAVSSSGRPSIGQPYEIELVSPDLFDRTLHELAPELLAERMGDLVRFDLEHIGPLSARDVNLHWDELLELWAACVRSALRNVEGGFALSVCHHYGIVAFCIGSKLTSCPARASSNLAEIVDDTDGVQSESRP